MPTTNAEKRRLRRYSLQVPVDITVLRSGVPDTIPGRAANICEAGAGIVLAGEVAPGEAVGLEVHFPESADALRARALVRHQDKLTCGLEFVGLSLEQQATIRRFGGGEHAIGLRTADTQHSAQRLAEATSVPEASDSRNRWKGVSLWQAALVLAAGLAGIGWWRWNRAWAAIEKQPPRQVTASMTQPRLEVAADLMEKLVVRRVEPEYPAAARQKNLQGVIVLDVVVGRDGSVIDLHPKNGPEELAQAAVNALRWWRFAPYRVNGEAVPVQTTLAIEFKP